LIIFFIWPLFNEIERNSEDLVSARNNIINLNAQISETNNFKKNYEIYKPNLEKIDRLFVDPRNPVDFIEFLENTASEFKITSKISLPPSLNSSQFIIVQFASKGSFSNTLNFVKTIETRSYLIEIEDLEIQNSDQNQKNNNIFINYPSRNVDATFTIKAFAKPN
jgi:hypothetical protein